MYKPIKTSEQHNQYLAKVYELMQIDLKPNSKESDELKGLCILIEAYEKINLTRSLVVQV